MPPPFRSALALTAAGLFACAPVAAQQAVTLSRTAPRVLSDITDTVKDDDGSRVTLHTVLTYDPAAGEYVQTVTEGDGRLRSLTVQGAVIVRPTAEEVRAAQAIIALDPEVSALMSRSPYPVEVEGGFQLVREAGHACGPGSRCLQYDVMEMVPGEQFGRRIRYVVVDLQTLAMVSDDFAPGVEGNLANPINGVTPRTN